MSISFFCPETFKYGKVVGAEEVISEELRDNKTILINKVVIERIAQFASYISEHSNSKVNDTRASESEEKKKQKDVITTNSDTKINCSTLMSHFKELLQIISPNKLLAKVSNASTCLSGMCIVQGAIGSDRKDISLFGCWTTKVAGATTKKNSNPLAENSILIKRDTIVLLDVKTGIAADTSIVTKPFRVVTIYDTFFNKWMIAKETAKKWKEKSSSYKLDVRVLNRDILGEFSDVELVGHVLYKKNDICRTIVEYMIISVVGKLELAA